MLFSLISVYFSLCVTSISKQDYEYPVLATGMGCQRRHREHKFKLAVWALYNFHLMNNIHFTSDIVHNFMHFLWGGVHAPCNMYFVWTAAFLKHLSFCLLADQSSFSSTDKWRSLSPSFIVSLSACGKQRKPVRGVQVQRRGKFSALLSVVLWYHRPLPQPLWAWNAHTHLGSLLLRTLGETLPTPANRHRHTHI